jgi:indoleamine 2,3-dioxygenase
LLALILVSVKSGQSLNTSNISDVGFSRRLTFPNPNSGQNHIHPAKMTYLTDSPPLPPLSELFPDIRTDGTSLPRAADPFTVTTSTGFLPCHSPLRRLPSQFDALSDILDDMPIVKADGSAGLVAMFKLGPLIDSGALPDLSSQMDTLRIDSGEVDLEAITALFRDYSFLASAYLLEPCWESWSKNHDAGYGLGRAVLPQCIASPLVKAADM